MEPIYPWMAGLCLTGLAVRTGYEAWKRHHGVERTNRAAFAVVFLAMCGLLASWPVMCPRDPWRSAVGRGVYGIGILLAMAGLGLAVAGLIRLRGVENIDHLVTTGVFARLRHPMYTGFILWIGGWVLAHGALVSLALGALSIANILYWRQLEERALETRYGEEYRAYRRRTRRGGWL